MKINVALERLSHRGAIVVVVVLFYLMACTVMLRRLPTTNNSALIHHAINDVSFKTFSHTCRKVEVQASNLKSQRQEDKILLNWFEGLCNGTYLEIGGLDGVKYSNTYVFNKELGWRGVLIELSGQNFDRLIINRPNELATIHAGVCDRKRLLHYVEGKSAVGGIWEFAAETFKERFWKGITLESPEVKPVECAPLVELLGPQLGESFYFDFFSLDVEGAEFEVIKSIDFTKLGFGIILAEADSHNQRKNMALRTFLHEKGYTYFAEYERSYWFVNNNFWNIYGDRLHLDEIVKD